MKKNILILNCGSSSVKYELMDMERSRIIAKGFVERVGMEDSVVHHHYIEDGSYGDIKTSKSIPNHTEAIEYVIDLLKDQKVGVIKDIADIYGIGHRVVHGGEKHTEPAYIDKEIKEDIKNCIDLAPLHNPHHLAGIHACEDLIPDHHQVAVFDTAFHQSIEKKVYIYALPYEAYSKYGVRKYGFHGTSHKYVSARSAEIAGIPLENSRIVSCHLGNGASACAVKNGKSIDTSMGFTPLSGLVMGTRCGDIDPAVLLYMMNKESFTPHEINTILNRHSGLLGISGVSRDFREILENADKGHERSRLAIDIYAYRIKKYIGSYAAALAGLDILVFTAGIGENSAYLREVVCSDMEYLGIKLDKKKNYECIGKEGVISSRESKVKVMVVPTEEELMIARETLRVIEGRKSE
ncbi:MAG: acetate/propionate family kinase [Elusimicrobiota bacterium]